MCGTIDIVKDKWDDRNMRRIKLIKQLLKRTGLINVAITFILYTLFTSSLLVIVEPGVNNIQDGLWLCFEVISTIGFGDIEIFSMISRVLVVILSLYSIFILALIPAIFVSYYMELLKLK